MAQYKAYESYLEKLTWIKEKSPSEKESAETLIMLIKKWDADHGTISTFLPVAPAPDPVKLLEALMKENKVNSSNLATTLGISQSGISDILHYRKELSVDMIARVAEKFKISPDLFTKPV